MQEVDQVESEVMHVCVCEGVCARLCLTVNHFVVSFCCVLAGSDVFLDKPIVVCMVPSTNEFSRAPSSHTCGCVLKIPDSYTSVQDLRREFNSILKSNIWVMDYA